MCGRQINEFVCQAGTCRIGLLCIGWNVPSYCKRRKMSTAKRPGKNGWKEEYGCHNSKEKKKKKKKHETSEMLQTLKQLGVLLLPHCLIMVVRLPDHTASGICPPARKLLAANPKLHPCELGYNAPHKYHNLSLLMQAHWNWHSSLQANGALNNKTFRHFTFQHTVYFNTTALIKIVPAYRWN